MKIELIDIKKLKEHEEIIHEHLKCVCAEIKKNKWIKPILVDKKSYIILDGHHRYNSFKKMGYKKIPVVFVDYFDDKLIELKAWRKGEKYSKKDVLAMVKSGKKYSAKTTRHVIKKDLSLPMVQF